MSKNLSELSGRQGLTNNLFERLGNSAVATGTPDEEALEQLSKEFLIGTANTYGTATFYDFMKPENKGKKVYICNGSACLCAGTQDNVINKVKNHFEEAEIGHMTCLGRCHENSAFHLAGKNYSGSDIEELGELIKTTTDKKDKYNVASSGRVVLTTDYAGFDKHYDLLKSVLKKESGDVLEEIKTSNIRGRGGAGFPMGFKLESCRNVENETKFIICNADEGDPGAYSDRYLLEERPHSVLFGMIVAGYVTGANWGVVYIRGEYPESVEIIEKAVQELRDSKLLGENIDNSGFDFDFKVIKAQGAYICGKRPH